MNILPFSILTIFLIAACSSNDKKRFHGNQGRVHLKGYQQYALDRVMNSETYLEQRFALADSFSLWSYDDVGNGFKTNMVTRTCYDGFFRYIFWKRLRDTALIYGEDSIPAVQLLQDTIFDANGDGANDLVVTYNHNNGNCSLDFTILFVMDTIAKKFLRIEIVDRILNAKFHPGEKTITSEVTCGGYKDEYKFKWTDQFRIDTIFSRTVKIL